MTNHNIYNLFSFFHPYESQKHLHRWLYKHYKVHPETREKAMEKCYMNSSVFHYEWLIGREYWLEGLRAPLTVKPLLFFYGLTHLLKGIILLKDPYYPASSEVLAHGVTTRKRKKKGYRFLEDEIKIQKKGFFPHMAYTMFHVKLSQGEKWKVKDLLLVDKYVYSLSQKLASNREDESLSEIHLPKLCIHYLLLYNLSMVTRYEGEWWGELLTYKQSEDYPIIKTYLTEAGNTVPSLFKPYFK